MMKMISDLRSGIMRRNARLVDWLVDQFGPTQIQMLHKKPGSSYPGYTARSKSPEILEKGQGTQPVVKFVITCY